MRLQDLAAFGGQPLFSELKHTAQMNLPEWSKLKNTLRGIVERSYFTNHGPLVNQLEQEFAKALGVRHAICVSNGTSALMIMCRALGMRGEVIVPAFTFPATVQALTWAGVTPVLCDVHSQTQTPTARQVEACITRRTTGVLLTHVWGQSAYSDDIQKLADAYALNLIFDACQAIGCTHLGHQLGNFGKAEAFSFHATKIVNATEGGCITTNDDHFARCFRAARSFHETPDDPPGILRMNGKMSEAQAAFALLTLEEFEQNLTANHDRYTAYCRELSALPGIVVGVYSDSEVNNYQYVNVYIEAEVCGLTRDELFDLLAAENIICRRHFSPGMHRIPPYDSMPQQIGRTFPVTDRLCERIMQLPNGQQVSIEDVTRICGLLSEIIALAPEIRAYHQSHQCLG